MCHLTAEMFSSVITSDGTLSQDWTPWISGGKGERSENRNEGLQEDKEGRRRKKDVGWVPRLRVKAQGFDWMPSWPMVADLISSPSRQPLTPMKRGFSVPNDHMAEGDEEGAARRRRRVFRPERKDQRDRDVLSSKSIKLEKFIIHHHTKPNMPTSRAYICA